MDIKQQGSFNNEYKNHYVKSVPEKTLDSFDFKGVKIFDKRLLKQFNETKELLYNLDEDSLLYGFRKRAGLPAPGRSLGGWYGQDFGNEFGQYLSGYARIYAVDHDAQLLMKAERLMHEWGKCIEDDGYFFYSNNASLFTQYIYDKLLGGLTDLYYYGKIHDALAYMDKITHWAAKNFNPANKTYAKSGSLTTPAEWYTISENLYHAYAKTGDSLYKELGDAYLYNEYYDNILNCSYESLMRAAEESSTRRYHAYSHVNTLGSAAMAYYISGEKKYLDVIIKAYEFLKDTQLFATGGYGPLETLLHPGQRCECLHSESDHCETSCCSWAAFKLVRYLIEFTGKSTYGDWSEKLIYNAVGATEPTKNDGRIMYFSRYSINGAAKQLTDNAWTCCTGTYPKNITEYYNQIYFKGKDGIYINLYLSSEVNWNFKGKSIALIQTSDFPANEEARFELVFEGEEYFKVCLRMPGWSRSDDTLCFLNDKNIEYNISDGWAVIERLWHSRDVLRFRTKPEIKVVPVEDIQPYPVALCYGPVVLAAKQDKKPLVSAKDIASFGSTLLRDNTNGKIYFSGKLENEEKIEFEPFYQIEEDDKYFMHFDPVSKIIRHEQIKYGPDKDAWESKDIGQTIYISKGYRANFTVEFVGNGIRWLGRFMEEGGRASVYIDGNLIDIVDQYGPISFGTWMWEKNGLSYGQHNLQVILESENNIDTKWRTIKKGSIINIIHLSVIEGDHL